MHSFDFLAAADKTPLTKKFIQESDGSTDVTPYPFVKLVNSFRLDVDNIDDLFTAIKQHASEGHCLLKGLLNNTLSNESRAGKTTANGATSWMLLDNDFDKGWESIESYLAELNPAWSDVSYIFQHSASSGIRFDSGLRGHIFILLNGIILPEMAKQWLKERNLDIQRLSNQIELAANGASLRWPLDLTTCQNDKLIYIAPPICLGVKDPLAGDRFTLVKKGSDFANVPVCEHIVAKTNGKTQELIEKLRESMGLPKLVAKYKSSGALNILLNPDEATISEVKEARGFTYLNLNGGNSWAYYFPTTNPELVFNFKGEPVVRLQDLAPSFHAQYCESLHQSQYGDTKPYAFRDPRHDIYYNVLHSPNDDELAQISTCSSKDKMLDFLVQYGGSMPKHVEDWSVVFDPTTVEIIKPSARWVNLYSPTIYIKHADRLTKTKSIPPVIDRILTSICGGCEETKDHFCNWLAYIFQTRHRTETSWIFHGVSGTGKGLLVSRVLRPLLGPRHVNEWTAQYFEEHYNAALETTLLLWLDEFRASACKSASSVMNKLKSYITEHEITLRGMRKDSVQTTNWLNVIISSNEPDPIRISDHDRRFNVAPAQERPLVLSSEQIEKGLPDELPAFASYLHNYPISENRVRTVLLNDAREGMIVASQTTVEQFFTAVRSFNLNWFLDYAPEEKPVMDLLNYQKYEQTLIRWCKQALKAEADPLCKQQMTRDEMMYAYGFIVGGAVTRAKFTRMCSIHRVNLRKLRVGDARVQGVTARFRFIPGRPKEFIDSCRRENLRMVPHAQTA